MEVTQVSRKIEAAIQGVEELSKQLPPAAQKHADAQAAYDKALGLTLAKLRLGVELTYEGLAVKSPPVTIMSQIAKAMCSSELRAKELATAEWRALLVRLENGRACMNALQSIYRHLENT